MFFTSKGFGLHFALFLICFLNDTKASISIEIPVEVYEIQNENLTDFSTLEMHGNYPPEFISRLIQNKTGRNKKLIAALLAFPFPFGIVGLHRIYLGTSPHVPIVYIGTLGGGFGLLPLIDFFAILFEKNMERYLDNNKVFMWVN